jgi:hypothetical protein
MRCMAHLSMHFALHGAVVLLSGFIGGLFFARAIKRQQGEVAWRVVHAGGCSAGAMLMALAVPAQWVVMVPWLQGLMAAGLLLGTYLLVLGMFVAAIWNARGIPGGGRLVNRVVSALYAAGTVLSLLGGALLVFGLATAMFAQ